PAAESKRVAPSRAKSPRKTERRALKEMLGFVEEQASAAPAAPLAVSKESERPGLSFQEPGLSVPALADPVAQPPVFAAAPPRGAAAGSLPRPRIARPQGWRFAPLLRCLLTPDRKEAFRRETMGRRSRSRHEVRSLHREVAGGARARAALGARSRPPAARARALAGLPPPGPRRNLQLAAREARRPQGSTVAIGHSRHGAP